MASITGVFLGGQIRAPPYTGSQYRAEDRELRPKYSVCDKNCMAAGVDLQSSGQHATRATAATNALDNGEVAAGLEPLKHTDLRSFRVVILAVSSHDTVYAGDTDASNIRCAAVYSP